MPLKTHVPYTSTNIQKAWEPEQAPGDDRVRRRGPVHHEDREPGHHQHHQVSLRPKDEKGENLFQFQVGRTFWGDDRWRQKGDSDLFKHLKYVLMRPLLLQQVAMITLFQVLSTMSMVEPNKMMHQMLGTDGGKDSVCTREFLREKMVNVCQVW